MSRKLRIAIAGISSENSMFSLAPVDVGRFQLMDGDQLLAQFPLQSLAGEQEVEWLPLLRAAGQSGGPVVAELYDSFVETIRRRLNAALPLDGVYLDMHGAIHVDGREDAEEIFVEKVRAIVGAQVPISISADPHGNLSRRLVEAVDAVAVHRHSPHIDTPQTKERAISCLLRMVRTGIRPVKAWLRVPILLPGERSGTFVEPGKTVFGKVFDVVARPGIWDAGLWVGYYWADEPRNSGAVFVTGDTADIVSEAAEELARTFWAARRDFGLAADRSGTLQEAFAFVEASSARPVFIADAGDNWTGGADGDLTWALNAAIDDKAIAAQGTRVLFAGLWDPASVDAALSAGVGAVLSRGVGAWLSMRYAPPVEGPWTVMRLVEGRFGEGVVAALLSCGSIDVLVQQRRAVFTSPDDEAYTGRVIPGQAWIDPAGYDAVVVKNGYLFPGQLRAAASHFMALTPGGTDLDPARLQWDRIVRPLFPFDDDFEPCLTAQIIPTLTDR